MKRSLALAAVLVVVLSAAAFAGVQEFAKFTIDVADGWTVAENQGTIIISKSDNTVKLSISVASIAETGVQTKPEVMELFVSEFRKSFAEVGEPVADEDGNYSWKARERRERDVDVDVKLSFYGSDFMLITIHNGKLAPVDVSNMINSIRKK